MRILGKIMRLATSACQVMFLRLAVAAATDPGQTLADTDLERSGAVIGEIRLDNRNIFDLERPGEDRRLYRLIDRLHVKTRQRVILRQLLFKSGDRYSRRLLEESERILRADPYLYDASVEPVGYHDGKVDVLVTTRDVWTFNPGIGFGRSGGTNTTGVNLQQLSLLGTGVAVSFSSQKDIDRRQHTVEVSDAHVAGTWAQVDVGYSNNSDGVQRQFSIDHPFYALDVRHAGGISGSNGTSVDSLYDRGQIVDQFREHGRFAQAYGGVSSGLENGWVRRWSLGATYDEHRFDVAPAWAGRALIPENRKWVYPWIQLELLQDHYRKLRNRDQIGRTEDFQLGASASIRVGWAGDAFGSSRNALLLHANGGSGAMTSESSTLLWSLSFDGRLESANTHSTAALNNSADVYTNANPHGTSLRNALLNASVRYYMEQSDNWLFFTTLRATAAHSPDLDNPLTLGGDNGLRGYPLRYQGGDGRALFTVEQRYFSDWYPLRLLRVGGAVFFDTGRTWGTAPLATPSLGLLKDVGLGLRLANSRSAFGGVLHLDVAFPLNPVVGISKVQFLVQAGERF